MSLPPALLQHVEQHPCFTGCYGSGSNVSACLVPNQALQPFVVVTCQDCLMKVGAPQALLPAGMTTYTLAQRLTDHMRLKRGFKMSHSGYHSNGPGFWLSFIYYDCGLFLINAERSRQLGGDLDVFLLGVQHKVVQQLDPRMTDARQFRTSTAYVHFDCLPPVVTSKQQLMSSPQVRTQTQPGWQKVTVAEFLPVVNAQSTPVKAVAAAKPLQPGDRCPACGALVESRPLLNGQFVGCLC